MLSLYYTSIFKFKCIHDCKKLQEQKTKIHKDVLELYSDGSYMSLVTNVSPTCLVTLQFINRICTYNKKNLQIYLKFRMDLKKSLRIKYIK